MGSQHLTSNNTSNMTTDVTPQGMILNSQAMSQIITFSEMMAKGHCTVPKHLQGNPADCMAIVMQSARWNMDPFAVAQKTHIVNGNLGYEAQLVNAVVSSSTKIEGSFFYEWFGPWEQVIGKFKTLTSKNGGKPYQVPDWTPVDEKGCGIRVSATLRGEDSPRTLELLLSQAQVRNSTLWASDPKQQLAYLGVKRWARLYAPDVILGVYTSDEFEDQEDRTEKAVNPAPAKQEGKTLPVYTQEQFNDNANTWANAISAGKATPEKIIAMVSSKYDLPTKIREQIETIVDVTEEA